MLVACAMTVAAVIAHAQTSGGGTSSVRLEKDLSNGLFTLTVRASAGIKEFSLYPPGKLPYGGGLGNCPTVFKNNNVSFADPEDFTPKMGATIIDCKGKSIDFDLLPTKAGVAVGKSVVVAAAPTVGGQSAPVGEAKPEPKSQILTNVKFPVPELGDCQSETECVSYCDDVAHAKACLAFAKKNEILPAEEVEKRQKLVDVTDGPGGCNSQQSCEAYCSDISKIDECFSFAQDHKLLSEPELNKIEKLKTVIKSGVKLPGGCNNEKSCESYCNNADHSDECLSFGEQSGFLDAQEIQQYRKFAELRKSGETPGNCSSKESCEAYCNGSDNADECISFAEKAGFLFGDELEQAKKVLPFLKAGTTPGGCRNKQQCQSYCEGEGHADECVEFGLKAGMISPQDAEIMKKTGGKGPGGCHGKDECQTYCAQNQQACASWAKDNGLEGQFSGPGGGGGGAGFSGPGGCKSKEECMAYCKDHQEECQGFGAPNGGGGGGEQHDGFTECGIVKGAVAEYVCGINGRGAPSGETTYFNRCHAEQQGVQILHEGACGKQDCSDIADPVCTNDGTSLTNDCHAERRGGVKHKGVCTQEDHRGNGGGFPGGGATGGQFPGGGATSGQFPGGPGGCKSQEECTAYCNEKEHQEECKNFSPPGGGSSPAGEGQGGEFPGGSGGGQQGGFSGGPGGCKSQEECTAYCMKNPDKCQGAPSSSGTSPTSSQQQVPQIPPPGGQSPQDYCASFTAVPKCDYVGAADSQNYKYCKQCFPDK